MQEGNVQAATVGIKELIESLARAEKRALKSHLIRLMVHVIKWKYQPERRSRSWIASIYNAREEITDIQEEIPSLTNTVVLEMWDKCFRAAKREVEGEINQKLPASSLSWEEVFDEQYGEE